tara:strand:+ start:324 stop:845 length:522 start_codon:yes stop_codon:yes gene_type:complete
MTSRIVDNGRYYATGRRKEASARVFLTEGTGKARINNKSLEEYFGGDTIWLNQALQPLKLLAQEGMFDLSITVKGGGINGQSGAVSLGIAKALDLFAKKNSPEVSFSEDETSQEANSADAEDSEPVEATGPLGIEKWHKAIRGAGLLTRDSRRVLRKKVGLVKARKAKQFSKR